MKETYKDLDIIISKFENGIERYQKDPLTRRCIEIIARGGDLIQIIDQLCKSNNNMIKQIRDYVEKHPEKYIYITDDNFDGPIGIKFDKDENLDGSFI